eukprot:gb/GFBE01054435.1/.p1 GENE.gb/GFBE01054435.1/~~gb/GFBE01054435.1/.p1  ORF type:complete len:302 (+),score=76.70 gb/GFBE01054435.1/:1-906(+)
MSISEEQRKARYLAMKQAMEMIESQPGSMCGSCTELQEKYSRDTRRLFQEVGHLREAVQKLVDKLAGHMPGESLRSFLQDLKLDSRLFTIHAGGDYFKKAPSEEPVVPSEQLDQVVAERDLAKMKLASVGRELSELKAENAELQRKQLEREKQFTAKLRRVEELEERLRAMEKASKEAPEPQHFEAIEPTLQMFQMPSDTRRSQMQPHKPTKSKKLTLCSKESGYANRSSLDLPSWASDGGPPASPQLPLPSLKTSPKQMRPSRSQSNMWTLGNSLVPDSSATLPTRRLSGLCSSLHGIPN